MLSQSKIYIAMVYSKITDLVLHVFEIIRILKMQLKKLGGEFHTKQNKWDEQIFFIGGMTL